MGATLQKMGILKKKKKKNKKKMPMLMNLPEEVLMKILIILPVKSLFLLTCVNKSLNKSLNSFLKDPYFIDLHMKQQHECILISSKSQTFLSFHSYDSLSEISPHLEIPYFDTNKFNVSWPCNGLVVCAVTRTSTIVLCNPTTREFKLLPSRPFSRRHRTVSFGLGFDSENNYYKVVKLIKTNTGYKFGVYNLSSNSWRKMDYDMPPMYDSSGVPCNGALYWIAKTESVDIIISFNLSTEVFQGMYLPDSVAHSHEIGKVLTIRNDSIALFAFTPLHHHPEPNFMDIWVTKEGSWAKQVRIQRFDFHNYIYPCLVWKNKALLVEIDGTFNVCTLDTKINTGIMCSDYAFLKVMVYKPSLISIK